MNTAPGVPEKPIVWWFTRGAVSLFTIPVFLLLVLGTVNALIQGLIQTLAYIKVTNAVWGWFGLVACLVFVWPFSLFMPVLLWWSAIKSAPGIYTQGALASRKGVAIRQAVITTVLLVLFSLFIQWGHGRIIGWIADRNPDAAFRAGVTGSQPPSWLKDNE